MAVGIAAAGFLPQDLIPGFRYVTMIAILLVFAGTALVMFGAFRYVIARRQIDVGSYEPATTAIMAISLLVGLLGLLAIPVVLFLR